ncbi:MAG: MFS transporter [Bifidobacteriaceae bacterium]|nr:MFS transporter [Bifidobacteriaceae bacterium]
MTRPGDLPNSIGWALGSGTILQGLNSAVLAVALVPISRDLGDSEALAWVVSALYLSAAVSSPTGGRLADLFGPKRVYLVGLAVALAAAVAGPFVPSMGWLIVDRFVLGIGTALQFPTAMVVIRGAAGRLGAHPGSALGVIAMCGQTTAALGPTIGGPIVALWGWQGIFWANVPVIANAALLVWRFVPADPPREPSTWRQVLQTLDPVGLALFVGALVPLMLGLLSLEDQPQWWWFGAFGLLAAAVVWWSSHRAEPFLDVKVLTHNRDLLRTCARAVATFISFYSVFYGLPQWLEGACGMPPEKAGLLVFPVFGVGLASTFAASRVARRVRPRVLLAAGAAAMVAAGLVATFFLTDQVPVWLIVLFGSLAGAPNGFNNLGNQLILHGAVGEGQAGVASGLYRTSQYVGAALASVVVAGALNGNGIATLGVWIASIGAFLLAASLLALIRHKV